MEQLGLELPEAVHVHILHEAAVFGKRERDESKAGGLGC